MFPDQPELTRTFPTPIEPASDECSVGWKLNFYGMVSVNGWKTTLQIWAVSALVTAIATGGALLIGYGVERL